MLGDSRLFDGVGENSEFDCAEAATGATSAATTTPHTQAERGRLKMAAMAGALLMSAAFSA
jgi:hypothetical protein